MTKASEESLRGMPQRKHVGRKEACEDRGVLRGQGAWLEDRGHVGRTGTCW